MCLVEMALIPTKKTGITAGRVVTNMRTSVFITIMCLSFCSGAHTIYADDITLSGQVWFDTDADGLYDSSESPLSGWTIMADRAYSAETAEDGTYELTVPAGVGYRVSVLCDANWIQTNPVAEPSYRYGGTQVMAPDNGDTAEVMFVKGDASGNLYLAGYFSGTVDFDPSSNGETLLSSNSSHTFITKLNADQSHAWTTLVPGVLQEPEDLAVTTEGIFVVGSKYSSSYGYIASLDIEGNLNWMHSFQSAFPYGICANSESGLYITGTFRNTVDFNPNEDSSYTQEAISYYGDLFLLHLSEAGEFLWVKAMGYSKNLVVRGQRICTDSEGNIYLAGYVSNGGSNYIDFDPGTDEALYSTKGDKDGFICRYDSDGSYAWTFKLYSSYTNQPYDMDIDALDRINVAGVYNGSTEFGTGGPYLKSSTGVAEAFALQLDPNGCLNWLETLDESSVGTNMSQYDAAATGICIDRFNNVYVVGERVPDRELPRYEEFDGGENDLFLWQLDENGEILEFDCLTDLSETPGTGDDYYIPLAWDVAVDALGDVHVCGRFSNNKVDLAPGTTYEYFSPQGETDGFIMTQENLHSIYQIDTTSGSQTGLDFGLWNVTTDPTDSNTVDVNSPPIDVIPL